jgi:class 3 adenylate cyclase
MGRGDVDVPSFARTIAGLMTARFAPASEPAEVRPVVAVAGGGGPAPVARAVTRLGAPAPALRTASLSDERDRALLRRMSARGLDGDRLIGTLYPDTTVLVLRLLDDVALAAPTDAGPQTGVLGRIVAAFQEIARDREVRYVKIMSNEIVAAEGFDGDGREAADTLGEIALALQNACARSFAPLGGRLDYAIGLDTGTVIGCGVGFEQTAYNIWGETVRVASSLAATAQRGTIQASAAAYERMRDRFVFRRGGGFYLEQVGEMTTYVLRGRL